MTTTRHSHLVVVRKFCRPGAVLLIALTSLLLRGCVLRPAGAAPLATFNRGSNAAWLGIEWVNNVHADSDLTALAGDLQRQQITTVFVYVSYLRADGTFRDTFAEAAPFLSRLRAAAPAIRVLAWVGIPLDTLAGGYADLHNPATRTIIIQFCRDLMQRTGFDGVQLDPEIVADHDPSLLTLLTETRAVLPKDALLSIATPAILPVFAENISVRGFWSADYYRRVAALVDQIAVMSYDSAMPTASLYSQWMRFEVIGLTEALRGWRGALYIGIPVSEERTSTHNPAAESLGAAMEGLQAGLNDAEAIPGRLTGLAIYPYWEMDAAKVAVYAKRWLGVP